MGTERRYILIRGHERKAGSTREMAIKLCLNSVGQPQESRSMDEAVLLFRFGTSFKLTQDEPKVLSAHIIQSVKTNCADDDQIGCHG
jgi:hypothetical protein